MLTTADIADFFQEMRGVYGARWKRGPDDFDLWRRNLSRFDSDDLRRAVDMSVDKYHPHPPGLPEVKDILGGSGTFAARANTYTSPPDTAPAMKAANRAMLHVLMKVGGVNNSHMPVMLRLKNAVAEEIEDRGGGRDANEYAAEELATCAAGMDVNQRRKDTERAREAFCSRQGIPYEARHD